MDYLLTNVSMNEIKCTTKHRELIGTKAIASCIGVLLYDKENKKALVGHFNSNLYDGYEVEDAIRIYTELCNSILDNKLSDDISYLIVPGIVGNKDRINNVALELEKYLANYKKMDIDSSAIKINVETESLEFVFDPEHNMFVTGKFYPYDDNYTIEYNKTK